ncbi:MAG: fructosamine kinase family protein [Owenweeksia sp.]
MTALNPNTSNYLLEELSPLIEGLNSITDVTPLSGGDINEACRLTTNQGSLFLKRNSARQFPGMFEKEAEGLKLLAAPGVIRTPEVIWFGEVNDEALLVLEFIGAGKRKPDFAENFGNRLAALHAEHSDYFGLDHDNYIGSLPQSNNKHSTWSDFMVNERLEPQFEEAYNRGHFHVSDRRAMERLFENLDRIFPQERPSLIHGDLWGGNYLVDENGNPVLIDPAVYYGHREMDIAMMHLFGGFDEEVFHYYDQACPLQPDWKKRLALCNLYPLLVHVNLFGGGYARQVMGNLANFV